ncbi:hypothetical protein TrLO_g13311 [Triparma laevis f. longispina]|uniref:CW-type domain-containing protein n=1 Tax=Triparma laevis f. longispina TaxID=1714387 RepID=A0A9W7KUM6_9STRA|nr:hypothetical protein TrLO_g13311 [Triparma laevis f. longispina]
MDMLGEGDWFCEMNTYDVRRNFCGAKEQSAEEVRKEREQARRDAEPKSPKRTKNTTNNRATSDPNPPYQNTPSTTPRPLPGALGTGEDVMKDTELVVAGLNRSVSAPGTLEQSPTNGANGKTPNPPQSTTSPTTAPTTAPKPAAPVEDMEWVQCEKCEKWRRLPPNLSAADLPDTWYCSMNTWDKSTATCAAKENEADNNVKGEYTILSGASAAAGKLSYRNLMFGTQGMNGGRPFSEKARAMDSVFTRVNGVGEAEAGYKGSSMFQSGGQKGAGAGNKIEAKPVFLKMFSKTRICKDLYNGVQVEPPPAAPLPKSEKEEKDPEDDSNPTISPTFKSLVFQSLSNKALAPYHCLLELQLRSYTHDGPTDSIRTRATVSSVEDALESLLREGLVEKVEGRMAGERLADSATLRYRAIREVSEKLARSKMLKVRKPWRHESDRNTTSNEEEQEELEGNLEVKEKRRQNYRSRMGNSSSPPSLTRNRSEKKGGRGRGRGRGGRWGGRGRGRGRGRWGKRSDEEGEEGEAGELFDPSAPSVSGNVNVSVNSLPPLGGAPTPVATTTGGVLGGEIPVVQPTINETTSPEAGGAEERKPDPKSEPQQFESEPTRQPQDPPKIAEIGGVPPPTTQQPTVVTSNTEEVKPFSAPPPVQTAPAAVHTVLPKETQPPQAPPTLPTDKPDPMNQTTSMDTS